MLCLVPCGQLFLQILQIFSGKVRKNFLLNPVLNGRSDLVCTHIFILFII